MSTRAIDAAPADLQASDSAQQSVAAPVAPGERMEILDVLRAFALLGILLVNFPGHASEGALASLDRLTLGGLSAFVMGSFYPLFSFLFGLGLGVQLLRAHQRGAAVGLIYFRRLLVLFLIGITHGVLVWGGDVLVDYAVIGLLLLAVHRFPARAIAAIAIVVLAVGLVYAPRVEPALAEWSATSEWMAEHETRTALRYGVWQEEMRIAAAEQLVADPTTALKGAVEERAWSQLRELRVLTNPINLTTDWENTILFAFLLGLYAGRRRWFEDVDKRRRAFAGLMAVGVLLAVGAKAYQLLDLDWGGEAGAMSVRGPNVGVTLFYLSLITLLVSRGGAASRALRLLAPAGRMGLTNYLVQSVVMQLVFFEPYGLRLPDPGTTLMLPVHVLLFLGVQVPLSHWWLRRFKFGPAEWLWRSLTYGSPQPMRAPAAA